MRRFAAQSVRAKICVSWQPLAVVQRQPSARAASFCVPILPKKMGLRAGPCGTRRLTASLTCIESSRTSRRLYGGYRNQTRDRGPAARATKATGTQPKPRESPQGVFRTSLWVRFGSLDCLDLASFELWLQERSKGGCQTRASRCNSSVSRSDAANKTSTTHHKVLTRRIEAHSLQNQQWWNSQGRQQWTRK